MRAASPYGESGPAPLPQAKGAMRQAPAALKRATAPGATVTRINDMVRNRQILREQNEARHLLVTETQKLKLQHEQLKRLLTKTEATAHKMSDPKAPERLMRRIEEEKLELASVNAKLGERAAALDAQVEAAKASAKLSKATPEEATEREALERESDKWDARLQLNMKKMSELKGCHKRLRELIDEALTRRVAENERLRSIRHDIDARRASHARLMAQVAANSTAAAAAQAEIDELREIAAAERAEFEQAEGAILVQLHGSDDDAEGDDRPGAAESIGEEEPPAELVSPTQRLLMISSHGSTSNLRHGSSGGLVHRAHQRPKSLGEAKREKQQEQRL